MAFSRHSRIAEHQHNRLWGQHRRFDAGKQIKGRKRFLLTDTQGLLLAIRICATSVSERQGTMHLPRYLQRVPYLADLCQRVKLVWVDGGYQGEHLINYVKSFGAGAGKWCWEAMIEKGLKYCPAAG